MESYETPIVTIDVVLLSLEDERLKVVLMERTKPPFDGWQALPGGYVHVDTDRDVDDAARRILQTKLGFVPPHIEQLETVSGASRDPRGWSVSFVYVALMSAEALKLHAKIPLALVAVDRLPALAFDHNKIVGKAVDRLRSKGAYSTLPCHLLPAQFTIPQMHRVYEMVLGVQLNRTSFTRKVGDMGALEQVGNDSRPGKGRLARLFQLKEDLSFFPRAFGEQASGEDKA